jgi:hypothetical protein
VRQILVDHARSGQATKRNCGERRITTTLVDTDRRRALALEDALDALATFDERKARAIELSYFGLAGGSPGLRSTSTRSRVTPYRSLAAPARNSPDPL